MAIVSFGDKDTSEFYLHGSLKRSAGWNSLKSVVLRKLDMIQYAIKINDQWRIIFKWTDAGAQDVRICDYH